MDVGDLGAGIELAESALICTAPVSSTLLADASRAEGGPTCLT
jgi:hypothetical protein